MVECELLVTGCMYTYIYQMYLIAALMQYYVHIHVTILSYTITLYLMYCIMYFIMVHKLIQIL